MENTTAPSVETSPDGVQQNPQQITPQRDNKFKIFAAIVGLLFLISAIGAGAYWAGKSSNQSALPPTKLSVASPTPMAKGDDVVCTMDAKICPNGSSVSRTGPNCEFSPCPSSDRNEDESPRGGSVEATWLTYTDSYNGYTIKYPPTNWQLSRSACASCEMNLIKPRVLLPGGVVDEQSIISIKVFETNSQDLKDWKNVTVDSQKEFAWSNLEGLNRAEKRYDPVSLNDQVSMEVLYVEKGSKTYVIYTRPGILPVENAILSSLKIK